MEFSKIETAAKYETNIDPHGIPRHGRDGRPKIFPEGGGKHEYYTRVTTYIDALSDKSTLSDWKLRQVVKGLSRRPDLLEDYQKIGDPDGHDKWKALKLAEQALEIAGGGMKAKAGTEMHDAIEKAIWGQDWSLPPDLAPDVAAFVHTTKSMGVNFLATEVFGVQDEIKAAGSSDYIATINGSKIAFELDLKTGSPWWAKTAMQLAVYSRCLRYSPENFERSPLVEGWEVDQTKGYFVHVPLGEGRCEVRPLNLILGWQDVLLAGQVREARKRQARKESVPEILASFNSAGESLAA